MTLIVGYAPEQRGKAALHLAAMLARSSGDELVICSVVPAPWQPGMARVDAEYREYLDRTADESLEAARAILPDDIPARFERHSARSATAGLIELAGQHDAGMIVVGSSSAGAFGHVVLGSVTSQLVHTSPVPVTMAPRGFRCRPDATVTRVTAAYGGSATAESLVLAAAQVAAKVGAALRIASFAVWTRPAYTTTLGTDSEDMVLNEWIADVEQTANAALEQVRELPSAPRKVEAVIGRGERWAEAIDDIGWDGGDLLVIGSSELGPVRVVFLGSRATKILRNSPVPVIVVPRSVAEELAGSLTSARAEA